MEWMPEALLAFFARHGRQVLIAGELAILGTLFIMLVYRLRKRYELRNQASGRAAGPAMPKSEVESLYLKGDPVQRVGETRDPLAPEIKRTEPCPPELSLRIDRLESRIRRMAMRARA